MQEPRGQELIDRYKQNYGIASNAIVTESMILKHWNLEKMLAKDLLQSTSENRWATFEQKYTLLYKELDWLNQLTATGHQESPEVKYKDWLEIIGHKPQRIYEIGSGKGEMISLLAKQGHTCIGTEITRERGQKYGGEHPNLSWKVTDGVHCEAFESATSYDVVISDQVIEHLHPDDICLHLSGVKNILADEGRYLFRTPQKHLGPWDVSRVFKHNTPQAMHLHEYTYTELKKLAQEAGFQSSKAVFRMPSKLQLILPMFKAVPSRRYMQYVCIMETFLNNVKEYSLRQRVAQLFGPLFFLPNIFMVAYK